MTNVNNNELGKFNEKAYRESRIERLNKKLGINGYRDIEGLWNSTEEAGGKFETVFGNYMTRTQVANFYACKNEEAVKNYSKPERGYKEELTEMGVKLFYPSDLRELKRVSQTLLDKEGDATSSLSIPKRGLILYPLEAVVRLGMFMTGTAAAKLFRDAIQTCLQEKQIISTVAKNTQKDLLEDAIKTLTEDKSMPSEVVIRNALSLLETTEDNLTRINENLENLDRLYNALDMYGNKDQISAIVASPWKTEVYRISSFLNSERGRFYEQLVEDINTTKLYTRTECFKEFFPDSYKDCKNRKDENEVTNKITKEYIKMKILKGVPFQQYKKETDSYKSMTSIVMGDRAKFLKKSKYGNFNHGNNEVLRVTELGKKYLYYSYKFYKDDKSKFKEYCLKDEKFLDYVYLQLTKED